MNIPSNFSLAEVVKYCEMPEQVRKACSSIFDKIKELEERVRELDKQEERLYEQLYFRDEFIRSTIYRCDHTTKHKDLVQQIKLELKESYIEL